MFLLVHVDEVVDDHAAEVAEADLAGDFLGGQDVHLVGGFLGGIFGAEVAAVDVDGHQGLGLVDHDRSTRLQRHLALMDLGDFLIQSIAVEERLLALVELQAVNVAGHHQLEELAGPLVGRLLVDEDRIHVAH